MKKFEDEPKKENSDRWLLTYSDMITLLLALFIILYSMSNIELEKFQELKEGFSNAFNTGGAGSGIGDGSGYGESSTDGSGLDGTSSGGDSSSESEAAGEVISQNPLKEIYQELSGYVKENDLENSIELDATDTFVRIRLKDLIMFVPDSDECCRPANRF